jgi:hypothetical protein
MLDDKESRVRPGSSLHPIASALGALLVAAALFGACANGGGADSADGGGDAGMCAPSALGEGGCIEPTVGGCCAGSTREALGCPCTDDGGGDSGGAEDGEADVHTGHHKDASTTGPVCGMATCDLGDMCLLSTIVAGPCQGPIDGGGCAKGTMKVGACCTPFTTTKTCMKPPAACTPLTCTCDPDALCATTNMCSVSGETLTCLQEGT